MSNHTSTSGANQDADTISGFTRLQNASIQANRVNGKIALATFIDLIRINFSNGRHTNYLLPADADYLADLIFGKPDFYEIEFIAQKYPNLRNYLQTRSEVYQTMIFPAVRGIRAMLSGSKNPVHPDLLSKGFLAELNRQIQLPNTREWLLERTKWMWDGYKQWKVLSLPGPTAKTPAMFVCATAFKYLDTYLEKFHGRICKSRLRRLYRDRANMLLQLTKSSYTNMPSSAFPSCTYIHTDQRLASISAPTCTTLGSFTGTSPKIALSHPTTDSSA